MNFENAFQLAGSIITLATITVVLTSPQTGSVIQAAGQAFSTSIRVAMGRG